MLLNNVSWKWLMNYIKIIHIIRLVTIIIYEKNKIFSIYFAYYCSELSILSKLHEKHQTVFTELRCNVNFDVIHF